MNAYRRLTTEEIKAYIKRLAAGIAADKASLEACRAELDRRRKPGES